MQLTVDLHCTWLKERKKAAFVQSALLLELLKQAIFASNVCLCCEKSIEKSLEVEQMVKNSCCSLCVVAFWLFFFIIILIAHEAAFKAASLTWHSSSSTFNVAQVGARLISASIKQSARVCESHNRHLAPNWFTCATFKASLSVLLSMLRRGSFT